MIATVNDFAIVVSEDDSFAQDETSPIVKEFVCGVCYGEIHEVFIPNEARVLLVCFEHGNICNCGRVTKNTVSIEMERSYKTYYAAINALPDIWPDLIERGFTREHAIRVAHGNVCAICGQPLSATLGKNDRYDVACNRHGNVSICGHIRPDQFVFNFQFQKEWEKLHPRPRTWEITK